MSNFAWWYYSVSFTLSIFSPDIMLSGWWAQTPTQWPWSCLKITAMWNSFIQKFYVLVQLSLDFVRLFCTSSGSLIHQHSFLLWHTLKGEKWHVCWFDKNVDICIFTDSVFWRSCKLCMIMILLVHPRFADLDLVSRLHVGHKILVHCSQNVVWWLHVLERCAVCFVRLWCVVKGDNCFYWFAFECESS